MKYLVVGVSNVVEPTNNTEKNSWVHLGLPDMLTELRVSARMSKDFYTDYPTQLQKLELIGANSEYDNININRCKMLTSLNIQGTAIKNLDVSGNLRLKNLIINSGLLEFTGNGIVMPDKLTWFADTEKIEPVMQCAKGQTIYSGSSQMEPIEKQDRLSIYNAATTEYQVLDEFGNDISSTWPWFLPF